MTVAEKENIAKEIKSVFAELMEYSERARFELFFSGYHNSPEFFHIGGDGKMTNYDDFKKICAEYYTALKEQKIVTTLEKIHVIDADLVVLGWSGNIIAHFKNGDVMKMNDYSITSVLRRINNEWKIIHAHESSLPPEIIKNRDR